MIRLIVAGVILAVAGMAGQVTGRGPQGAPGALAQEAAILVTSADDDPNMATCPHESDCTLRAAIEAANAGEPGEPLVILFDTDLFDPGEPVTIQVIRDPLPPVTRPGVTIDASNAGVILLGTGLSGPQASGLVLQGEGSGVMGLHLRNFAAAGIFLSGPGTFAGEPATGGRNHVDDSGTGILATGEGSRVTGNVIGMAPAEPAAPVMTQGIVVAGDDITVGLEEEPIQAANAIGNVETAVVVGRGAGEPFSGVRVQYNLIGESFERGQAPVETGVLIDHPASGVIVTGNTIHNASTGIAVVADDGALSSAGNRLDGNSFEDLVGLAIDLQFDSMRNPNDPGDEDTGPNTMLNSPVILESTQARISGTACAGCRVRLYLAMHEPGGEGDFPRLPVIGGQAIAGESGQFTISSPLVSAGDWIMALATDEANNTSEFAAAVHVGAGAVQCGNVVLNQGWNLVGYFGSPALPGSGVVPDSVRSIHQLQAGGSGYLGWFPEGGGSLDLLQAGEPYWFWADSGGVLSGGLSLSSSLPVGLGEGWNDFVYIGAAVHVADGLASLGGQWSALHRYVNNGNISGWRSYGGPDTPGYAHGFEMLEPCAVYRIHMTGEATLVPLEP